MQRHSQSSVQVLVLLGEAKLRLSQCTAKAQHSPLRRAKLVSPARLTGSTVSRSSFPLYTSSSSIQSREQAARREIKGDPPLKMKTTYLYLEYHYWNTVLLHCTCMLLYLYKNLHHRYHLFYSSVCDPAQITLYVLLVDSPNRVEVPGAVCNTITQVVNPTATIKAQVQVIVRDSSYKYRRVLGAYTDVLLHSLLPRTDHNFKGEGQPAP